MTWGHALSAARRAVTAFASRAFSRPSPSGATSGPVAPTARRERRAALRLSELEILIAELRRMHRCDPRRGRLRRRIYSMRHEVMADA